MNEQIFVTGASGFAGRSLTKYLERKKFKVTKTVFKNSKYKKDKTIDLTKKIYLKKNFKWIIHIASHHKIEDFESKPKLKAKRNILMVKNLIDFVKRNNVENFIFFSTIDINYSPYPSKKDIYIKSKTFCEKILLTAFSENLLKRLPNGLDGNLGEKGTNLSGGEIQRIGLCRALIYDPEILFLDEATSSLDVNTESQILDELKIFQEKTIISIAHRIDTLKNCDKIYCFDNRKIVDQGNFDKFKMQN